MSKRFVYRCLFVLVALVVPAIIEADGYCEPAGPCASYCEITTSTGEVRRYFIKYC